MSPDEIATIAKALSNPARVRIVDLLALSTRCPGPEVFGSLQLAQSTVSEHLRILREAGVVTSSQQGSSAVYSLDRLRLERFAHAVGAFAGAMSGPDDRAPYGGTD